MSLSHDLLIASPARWDECCFAVPAVRALAASGLGVGVLCEPHQASFWQSLDGIEVLAEAIKSNWKAALIWEDGRIAKKIAKAGIERRVGPPNGKLAKRLTHPLQDLPHPTDHRVQFYLTAVEEMGVPTSRPEFFAPLTPPELGNKPSILLSPDSDFGPSHEWLIDRWQELTKQLLEAGHVITIACLPSKRMLSHDLVASIHADTPFEIIDLTEAPLDFLAKHPIVIAADGSLPHLAAHAGATCITLFGPNDPQWKRPLGKRNQVIRRHVECAPCLLAKCPLDLRCQKELELEQVMTAIDAILGTSVRNS